MEGGKSPTLFYRIFPTEIGKMLKMFDDGLKVEIIPNSCPRGATFVFNRQKFYPAPQKKLYKHDDVAEFPNSSENLESL